VGQFRARKQVIADLLRPEFASEARMAVWSRS